MMPNTHPDVSPLDYQTPEKEKRSNWKIILPLSVVAVLLGLTIVLPFINRLRHQGSNRTPATDHLHQIGLAILLYTLDHNGKMPPTLADLIVTEQLSPNVLIDPESTETPATGNSPQAIATNVARGGHQTFIYLGAGLNHADASDATTLIAYEPLSVYQNGTNALFGDGHSEWLDPSQLTKTLSAQAHLATSAP